MNRLEFIKLDTLPRLAWCARISPERKTVVVEHGPWVETQGCFFVEGAWDAPFSEGNFHQSTTLLGSGGRMLDGELVFCTSTHTMERLQSVRVGNEFFISNSFPYLLAATGDTVDVNYRFYERDFLTFLKGRRKAKRNIRTAKNRHVRLYYGERIYVSNQLEIKLKTFPQHGSFSNFDDYVAHVDSLIKAIHQNAGAASRNVQYNPISTLSTGYDSPACTIFAKKVGCEEAITFLEARTLYNPDGHDLQDTSDSGADIAAHLNVKLTAFNRDDYLAGNDLPEAEFLATGNGGDDVVISVAEKKLSRKMLFTGFLGDTVWGLNQSDPEQSSNYVYAFPAGGTLGEFRIRVGFIHVPVPLLTYRQQPQILRISRSSEMAEWSVGGEYDRPIPRRLVETNGVPRELYAKEKKAVTQPFWLPTDFEPVRKMMSAHSYQSLVAYCSSKPVRDRLSLASKVKTVGAPLLAPLPAKINWYNTKLQKRVGIRLMPLLLTGQFRTSVLFSTLAGLKFHWAVEETAKRYRSTNFYHK